MIPNIEITNNTCEEIQQALSILFEENSVVEIRILNTAKNTVSGYYTDLSKLAEAAMQWDGKAPGVYVTLNPVDQNLLARSANKVIPYAKHTTSDSDILKRRWLPIDFDPKRPAGISSTDEEHQAAIKMAEECRDWLRNQGWPEPIVADSGNGAHLLYRIDLPNDVDSANLVKKCLEAIAFRFNNESVDVDLTTFNAARIWKLYGTMACKGDSLPYRPHRRARVIETPEKVAVVGVDYLTQLAAMLPEVPKSLPKGNHVAQIDCDLDRWLHEHNLPVASVKTWNGGHAWILNPCPWNDNHTNRSAYVIQFSNGAVAAGCHHNGCKDNNWHALRALVEPGWQDCHQKNTPIIGKVTDGPVSIRKNTFPWPEPPNQAAFYGLAGDIVRLIEPHTESDSMAILIQMLIGFGNIIGSGPHFMVEADRHALRTNAVLVGDTSKGRKGTSWGHIRRLFAPIDKDWECNRIQTGLSSGEGLIWAVRDQISKMEVIRDKGKPTGQYQEVIVDQGITDKRLLVIEPEFASPLRVMERDGNTLSPMARQAWDNGNLKALTKNSPAQATGAHISILGHITKEELRRYLNRTETGNGFANRFLWVCVKRSKCLPEGGRITDIDIAPFISRIRQAVTFAQTVGEIKRDSEANTLWHQVYPTLSEGKPGLFGAVTSRGEAQVMRLAGIFALLDRSPLIRITHLQAALAVWEYCEQSAKYIFSESLGDPVADMILQTLHRNPSGLTRTDIINIFGRNKDASQINNALCVLLEQGLVRNEIENTQGGRPAERWFLVN